MEGTVNDANLEVLAFDCTGAAGDESLASGGAIFDAMTMGCFKFDSSLDGLGTAFNFSIVLAGLSGFAGLIVLTALVALTTAVGTSVFLTNFLAGTSTILVAFVLSTGFAMGLLIFLETAFMAVLATDFVTALEANL